MKNSGKVMLIVEFLQGSVSWNTEEQNSSKADKKKKIKIFDLVKKKWDVRLNALLNLPNKFQTEGLCNLTHK